MHLKFHTSFELAGGLSAYQEDISLTKFRAVTLLYIRFRLVILVCPSTSNKVEIVQTVSTTNRMADLHPAVLRFRWSGEFLENCSCTWTFKELSSSLRYSHEIWQATFLLIPFFNTAGFKSPAATLLPSLLQ